MESNISFPPTVVAELKWAVELAGTNAEKDRLLVKEPPHFFCTHGDESVCARVIQKRKRDEVADLIPRYEKYVEHLKDALEQFDSKKVKLENLKAELEKTVEKPEEPVVAAAVAPAPVVAPPNAAKPAAAPKGTPNGAAARR